MDTYQAIYDAVRSKIGNADIGLVVESAIREANLSHFAAMAAESVREAAALQSRPSVLFKPVLTLDGNKWCALYGPDLQLGVCGFGDSPDEAMLEFDHEWTKKVPAREGADNG